MLLQLCALACRAPQPATVLISRRMRSLIGLPIIPAAHPFTRTWNAIAFLVDGTYTAVLLPMLVGFRSVSNFNNWSGIIELIAGTLLSAVA